MSERAGKPSWSAALRRRRDTLWGILDQGVFSLCNFGLSLAIVHHASPTEFGAFSLAYAIYWLALGASRAITSEPLVVRHTTSSDASWRGSVKAATGTSLAAGAAAGAACVSIGLLAPGVIGSALVAIGVSLPGILLQDAWRYAFFARNEGSKACLNDSLVAVFLVVSFGWLLSSSHQSVGAFVLAWGASTTLAGIVGALQAAALPSPARFLEWWKEHVDLASRFLLEFVAFGASTLAIFAVGALAGLEAAGAMRAGQILLAPITVLIAGTSLFAIPAGVRSLEETPHLFQRRIRSIAVALGSIALVWGAVIASLPDRWGTAVLSASWAGAHAIIVPLTAWMIGVCVAIGPHYGLRALGAARRSLRARLIVTPLALGAPAVGALLGDALGAALGLAIVGWAEAAVWWTQFSRGTADHAASSDVAESLLTPGTSVG